MSWFSHVFHREDFLTVTDDDNTLSLIETSSEIPSDHQQQEIKHAYDNDIVGDEDIDEVGKDVISCNSDIDLEDTGETSFSGTTDEAGFTDLTEI